MGILLLPDGSTRIRHPYRRDDGRATWKQTTIDSQDKRKIAKAMLDLVSSVEGSLTDDNYKHLSQLCREQKGDIGMTSVFNWWEQILGQFKINKKFVSHYLNALSRLKSEGKAVNTISNYKAVVQRVLNFAYEQMMIDSIPIRNFDIHREFRSRVWKGDERERFWNTVNKLDSHLKWALKLAERRPIRKMDIAPLTTENLVLAGKYAPYIRFRPKKTSKRKPRDTYLPLFAKGTGQPFDEELFNYLVSGRPRGCPYLFPRIGTERNGLTSKLRPGDWRYLGDPDRHMNFLLDTAGISDFVLHDLKHVSLTYMIKTEGWSCHEIKDLGIQYSDEAIKVYLNLDAEDALSKCCSNSVAYQTGIRSESSLAAMG